MIQLSVDLIIAVPAVLTSGEGQGGWTNLSFAMAFAICCVNFWRSVTLDPGYVPHSPTDLHLKSVRSLNPRPLSFVS